VERSQQWPHIQMENQEQQEESLPASSQVHASLLVVAEAAVLPVAALREAALVAAALVAAAPLVGMLLAAAELEVAEEAVVALRPGELVVEVPVIAAAAAACSHTTSSTRRSRVPWFLVSGG